MDPTGASTAIMIAIAAALWFLYFVPSWIRRREHLATERTATRLQQTMRVLAETAEVPETVRVEASAREAAHQERKRLALERQATRVALREARAAAEARREIAALRLQERAVRSDERLAPPRTSLTTVRRRLARTRRLAGLLLLAAFATTGVQLWLVVTTGWSFGGGAVLAACAAAGMLSIAVQGRIHDRLVRIAAPATRVRHAPAEVDVRIGETRADRGWTPVTLPRPLYVERPDAAPLRPSLGAPTLDAAALLRVAAAEAERSLREAHAEPEVVRLTPRPAETPSRFASMGIIDTSATAAPDLDEVLRRRRNVG